MTCSNCFIAVLDNAAPSLRSDLHGMLDKHIGLPLSNFQGELDAFNLKLSEISGVISGFNIDIGLSLDLTSDIQAAMSLQGINPGDCPQLDQTLANIQGFTNLLNGPFANPFSKALSTVQGQISGLSSQIGTMNALIAAAGDNKC